MTVDEAIIQWREHKSMEAMSRLIDALDEGELIHSASVKALRSEYIVRASASDTACLYDDERVYRGVVRDLSRLLEKP